MNLHGRSRGKKPLPELPRVQAGAAYLDEKYPDWHNEIDVETLTMHIWELCVLGQLRYKGIVPESTYDNVPLLIKLGFVSSGFFVQGNLNNDVEYEDLRTLWLTEIVTRLNAA